MQTFRFLFESYGAFSWLFLVGSLTAGLVFAHACWAFKGAQILQLRRERFRLRQELALREKSVASKPALESPAVKPAPEPTPLPQPPPVAEVLSTPLPAVRSADPIPARRASAPAPVSRSMADPASSRSPARRSSLREDRQLGLVFYLAPDQPDALDRLNSITPALVKDLNMLGIYKFEQIARWSEVNLRSFALLLGMDPAELERLDWVRQAKVLHGETHGSKMMLAA